MKCRYKHCKLGGKVDREDAIKIGNAYYHKECRREIEHKKEIERLYYEKFKLKESFAKVRGAINKYVSEYPTDYILHILNQDIKLNSVYGISYYLRDSRFQKRYERDKAKLVKFDINKVEIEEPSDIAYSNKPKKQLWGDIICT